MSRKRREKRPLCPKCGRLMKPVKAGGHQIFTIDWKDPEKSCGWWYCDKCGIELCVAGNKVIYAHEWG